MGMRLAGIEGVVAHEPAEVERALSAAMGNKEIGVILMTAKLIELCHEYVYDLKLNRKRPLIVEIPDRHGSGDVGRSIERYVKEALGI